MTRFIIGQLVTILRPDSMFQAGTHGTIDGWWADTPHVYRVLIDDKLRRRWLLVHEDDLQASNIN